MSAEIKIEKTTAELFDSYGFVYHKDCKVYLVTGFPKSELAEFVVGRDFKHKSKWIMYEKSTGLRLHITSSKTRKEAIRDGVDMISALSDQKIKRLVERNLFWLSAYRSK